MKLFQICDDERPMFVTAVDFPAALKAWRDLVASEDDSPDAVAAEAIDPDCISLVCDSDELLITSC